MKIIITEGMLKNIVVNEAFDPDVARIANMQRQADANYYAKNPAVYNRGLQQNMSQATNDKLTSFVKGMLPNLGGLNNGNNYNDITSPGTWDGKQIENLGNWNVKKSIQYLVSNTGNKSSHKCATYVEDAIAAGGLPRMNCSMNGGDGYAHSLHYKGTLSQYGFKLIDSGTLQGYTKYNGQLQPGDIMVSDTIRYTKDPHKNHIAMWTGNQWISDFKQNNANVYKYPADFWIYRYTGGQQ